jgi:hypothetical protein
MDFADVTFRKDDVPSLQFLREHKLGVWISKRNFSDPSPMSVCLLDFLTIWGRSVETFPFCSSLLDEFFCLLRHHHWTLAFVRQWSTFLVPSVPGYDPVLAGIAFCLNEEDWGPERADGEASPEERNAGTGHRQPTFRGSVVTSRGMRIARKSGS